MLTESHPLPEEPMAVRESCSIPKLLKEPTEGTLITLPGCNGVTGKGPMVGVVHHLELSYPADIAIRPLLQVLARKTSV